MSREQQAGTIMEETGNDQKAVVRYLYSSTEYQSGDINLDDRSSEIVYTPEPGASQERYGWERVDDENCYDGTMTRSYSEYLQGNGYFELTFTGYQLALSITVPPITSPYSSAGPVIMIEVDGEQYGYDRYMLSASYNQNYRYKMAYKILEFDYAKKRTVRVTVSPDSGYSLWLDRISIWNKEKPLIPDFSGEEKDLNDFTDMILEDMTLEQLANYALSLYSEEVITPSGYMLPIGSMASFTDALTGVDTNFPMSIHVAQSWNKELAKRVGAAIGDERRGLVPADDPNTLLYCALGDIRCNPLNGRLYEGFAEDPYMVAELVDKYGEGAGGEDGFYTKSQINTKHYGTYHSEWNRTYGTYYISSRGLYEYQMPSFFKTFKNNHHVGLMSSFGGINGLQNPCSPYVEDMQDYYRYSLFGLADYDGDYNLLLGTGNGYDETYAQTKQQVAAMSILSGVISNNHLEELITKQDYIDAVNNGVLGITIQDLREHVRPQVELWVRGGYFNQPDYPYRHLALDQQPVDRYDQNSQATALEAAEEGFVLLKNNNNILPLGKDSKVMTTGIFADYDLVTSYAKESPEDLENSRMTPITAMRRFLENEAGEVTYVPEIAADRLRIKSVSQNKYIAADGNQLKAVSDNPEDASQFYLYDWGQKAYSFLESESDSFICGGYENDDDSVFLRERDPFSFIFENYPALTYEDTEDGKKVIRYGSIPTELIPRTLATDEMPYYAQYTKWGWFLSVDDSGLMKEGPQAQELSKVDDTCKFEVETIHAAGEGVEVYAADNDYAVVFIGSNSYIAATEFNDRVDLNFGQNQLDMLNKVTEAFPGKTIVVIRTDLPMACQELQDNDDIAAIVYASYAGQYDNYALMRILYGDATPSGKLTSTWLKDTSSLPVLDREREEKIGFVDPQYKVDMRNADPISQRLSYLYNDPADATYPFGYGLSYTEFDRKVQNYVAEGRGRYTVTVEITNTGACTGQDIIQLYAGMEQSRYGEYTPSRRLVGFEKTARLQPGESQTVTVSADIEYLKKWDVAQRKYILETGAYIFALGTSSQDIFYTQTVPFFGEEIGKISLELPVNVWESSYAATCRSIEYSKKRSTAFNGGRDFFAAHSWYDGDYAVMPRVVLDGVKKLRLNVATTNPQAEIELYTGGMDGDPIATAIFSETKPIQYYLDADETIEVNELGYTTIDVDVTGDPGTEDLYIVFKKAETRLESIQAV